ncbi:MFS transporter [Burkholderia cepacia]|uniref:MFS transporter n=1 Tax=Burkholderia cepacia TaxID=292 RepID=A0ABN5D2H2_BURCE|nr:MFS transporter [Burkholderia cepacia]AIO26147.1 drug resistance MFS transporter, drug:H+ antiporter-2 family protein [Burkholderia cepacia ATCC 25416]ALK23466.1 multidrug MFS transporter [Burkholderia cepacia ATCC 25416]ASE92470.1 MFS transporter [Burkholderia cepacia]ATF80510.1 MFS transporter [Burkholderia cepacia]MCA8470703.1 MFS transporter [Burkholderia cepacia]
MEIAETFGDEGFDIPRRYFAAVAILVGVFMSALDSAIVNIALPTISTDLRVSAASVIWVANGYQVASAATMLTCASLGSRIGERRFYTIGLVLFTIASLGCGLASTFGALVAMRVLQGISYAILISVGYGLYRVIFPPASLGTIFGVNALVFAVGTAVGPALGGLIVSWASWPWLFFINLPFGIAAIAFSFVALGKDTHRERGFDVPGAVTSAAAFGLLALAVDQIGRWSNRTVLVLAVAAAVLMLAFCVGQARARHPLLPLDIFRSRRYTFAVLTSVTMFVSQGMALVALPFVLQHTYAYGVLKSALVFTPWPIAVALCAPFAGRLANRFNATQLSSVGVLMFCLGIGSLILLPAQPSPGDFMWRVALCGVGYGFFLPPNNKEMFANAAKNRTATASGVLSTARTTGQSIGAALVAVVIALVSGAGGGEGERQFPVYVFALACAIAALSFFASVARIYRQRG